MTASNPAFTSHAVEQRVGEMREIVGDALHHILDDLERDEAALSQQPATARWLWVPHDSGTYLAPLVPHGKRWAREVVRRCSGVFPRTRTPYLITPDRVTAITWEVAVAMIELLPEPDYVVMDKYGAALLSTNEWRMALTALQYDENAAALAEAATGSVLATKPPRAA